MVEKKSEEKTGREWWCVENAGEVQEIYRNK